MWSYLLAEAIDQLHFMYEFVLVDEVDPADSWYHKLLKCGRRCAGLRRRHRARLMSELFSLHYRSYALCGTDQTS